MKPNELELLLTVARILRAHLRDTTPNPQGFLLEDVQSLNEALAPWESLPGEPINEAAQNPQYQCKSRRLRPLP